MSDSDHTFLFHPSLDYKVKPVKEVRKGYQGSYCVVHKDTTTNLWKGRICGGSAAILELSSMPFLEHQLKHPDSYYRITEDTLIIAPLGPLELVRDLDGPLCWAELVRADIAPVNRLVTAYAKTDFCRGFWGNISWVWSPTSFQNTRLSKNIKYASMMDCHQWMFMVHREDPEAQTQGKEKRLLDYDTPGMTEEEAFTAWYNTICNKWECGTIKYITCLEKEEARNCFAENELDLHVSDFPIARIREAFLPFIWEDYCQTGAVLYRRKK